MNEISIATASDQRGLTDREVNISREDDSAVALAFDFLVPWWEPTKNRVTNLMMLPENWDHQGASRIHRDTALFALTMLDALMTPQTPLPQIVPLAYGGLQIEWHERNIDLEIEVSGPNEVYFSFDDYETGADDEAELADDFSRLDAPLHLLSTRA
tara:strand:- start:590 stop:1057 length:468 start_codon:yes stop_codon:yes gene_type:complete